MVRFAEAKLESCYGERTLRARANKFHLELRTCRLIPGAVVDPLRWRGRRREGE